VSQPEGAEAVTTANAVTAASAAIAVDTGAPGAAISADLFGVFFEDLNSAADGGLYAELIQNRSFAYAKDEQPGWHALTAWEVVTRGGGMGGVEIAAAEPSHPHSPHYAVLRMEIPGEGVGLRNEGFDGIPVRAGERYDLSLLARRAGAGGPIALTARLESKDGREVYGQAVIGPAGGAGWTRHTATIEAQHTDPDARFTLLATEPGVVHLDLVSLFPRRTFRGRPNGLRADLAQAIADLRPKFVRFPGGCVAHGNGLGNMYRWQDTLGPLQARRQQRNLWGYHQSAGLGYFEYFQFCEDIGAKPLPVVPAGVCCQNSDGGGQRGVAMDEMPAYVQEVLDLVEYANGPATSRWGAVRAAAGHPEPFGLEYLGVGNEDTISSAFRERFAMIHAALRERHPEITVIGTVGPSPVGEEWEKGWAFARETGVAVVDEHSYKSPRWFLENTRRFDDLDGSGPAVYVGEYAARDNTLRAALAEAAYMIAMERNGDVVKLASYAPLLAKRGHTQWLPDLVYFDNTTVWPTLNYHVQWMHSVNSGDTCLPVTVTGGPEPERAGPAERRGIFVGTYDTAAEFAEIRVNGEAARGAFAPEGGTWQAVDGVYRQTQRDGVAARSFLADVADADGGALTLQARKLGGAEGFAVGVGTPGDFYQWSLGGWRNRSLTLQRGDDGCVHDLTDPVPGPIEPGRWYDIRIEWRGNRIRCFLDGELIHDLDDVRAPAETFAVSAVRESGSGDVIVKVVNATPTRVTTRIEPSGPGAGPFGPAVTTTLAADPADPAGVAAGEPFAPAPVTPEERHLPAGEAFDCELPPYSFTVLRATAAAASRAG
jgi:alpha-L-arabinofuranosidase